MSALNSHDSYYLWRCCMDFRCKHGVIDPEWCYDCFYDETPDDEDAL